MRNPAALGYGVKKGLGDNALIGALPAFLIYPAYLELIVGIA